MKRYGTILMDPPWLERGWGKIKRGADRHYPLMKTEDIRDLIVGLDQFSPAENAHLYMWVTNNFLPDGLRLMEFFGFDYKTNLVWVKESFGLGYYFRGQHELILFGVRGKHPRSPVTHSTVLHAPRREHSRKPDEVYDLIEECSPGPYLEIFARRRRENWDAWGNEI